MKPDSGNNNSKEEVFKFEEDKDEMNDFSSGHTWKVLISDDEEDVHILTRLVLRGYRFEGHELEFISAYSGEETKKALKDNPDTALILLDVVMEDYDTGLKLVKHIREEMENRLVRIILRTGQAGKAPEREVVAKYDINDYKTKTELTSDKLYTTITSSLRSYRDLNIIEKSRKGLRKIIDATSSLFEIQSLEKLAGGILTQLTAILDLDESSFYARSGSLAATRKDDGFYIIAATGQYEENIGNSLEGAIPAEVFESIKNVINEKKNLLFKDCFIGFFKADDQSENLIYLKTNHPLTPLDQELIEIFCSNVLLAFNNIYSHRNELKKQRDIISRLSQIIEKFHGEKITDNPDRLEEIFNKITSGK